MMDTMSRSFKLEGPSWKRLGRSNSSLVASELVSSEIARVAAYERLSQSMRLTINEGDDYSGGGSFKRKKFRPSWTFLVRAFSFKKRSGGDVNKGSGQVVVEAATEPAEKKKRRSSWLPDPHRRWPVQGW